MGQTQGEGPKENWQWNKPFTPENAQDMNAAAKSAITTLLAFRIGFQGLFGVK